MALTTAQVARYRRKAATTAAAWTQTIGGAPSLRALILVMAVAEFETRLGDAGGSWEGEHNWGAVHKRALTPGESAILLGHGVFPTTETALRTARGLLTAGANEALHIDHSSAGAYFVWLWSFPSDTEAAAKFLEVLVKERPSVRAILDTASPDELAAAMYASHYFEGFSAEPAENVHAYGAQIATNAALIESAIDDGTNNAAAPPATSSRGISLLDIMAALSFGGAIGALLSKGGR